ncbi:MAG: hypothetical protein KBS91_01180, partial [Firmicutes bacterium]|nr:hypothetical protein [Candidatus Caballimonas caccae]
MYADVIVDITNANVDKVFEYYFSDSQITLGSRVIVPFGKTYIEGIVIGVKENSVYDKSKIKAISRLIEDTPALTEEMVKLMAFMCDSYYITKAQALRLFLPSEMRKGKVKEKLKKYINLTENLTIEDALSGIRKSAIKQIELVNFIFENKRIKVSVA